MPLPAKVPWTMVALRQQDWKQTKVNFRTPGLRNVIHTAPYLHNGSISSLSELINLLSQGMPQKTGQQINGTLSPHIQNVRLSSKEQENILAFLESLSSVPSKTERPVLP
ncbi:Cytochrome c551 peroxidase precursor [Sphingobacterium multivorum]|uniref:Cytochrome c551 peroxidase n=1 Tax=Sphingobacterium multivorum TaxID=28454 RepID=A0A2X2L902_SPHMU|nr:hypothetical protein [Sphingobacterium multivorum]SPZ85710.1 Cytochrome c551 peroxidase precursor [Sphingobacterium multivorum]